MKPLHFIHVAVVNSWINYQEVGGRENSLEFLTNISCFLMNSMFLDDSDEYDPEPVAKCKTSVTANQFPNKVHKRKSDHWPLQTEGTTERFKFGESKWPIKIICSKCQVTRWVIGNDSFLNFHGVEQKQDIFCYSWWNNMTGPNLVLFWIQQSNIAPLCENYAKL